MNVSFARPKNKSYIKHAVVNCTSHAMPPVETSVRKWGGAPWRELYCQHSRRRITDVLHASGYRTRHSKHSDCRTNAMYRMGFRVTRDLYKLMRNVTQRDVSVATIGQGSPCVLILTRLSNEPWCVLIPKHFDDAPRMFLLRHRFSDAELFDGTIFEGVFCWLQKELVLTDVLSVRGRLVSNQPLTQRCITLQTIVNTLQSEDALNAMHLQCATWNVVDKDDVTEYVAELRKSCDRLLVHVGNVTWLLLGVP